jgi:hypothetical protein
VLPLDFPASHAGSDERPSASAAPGAPGAICRATAFHRALTVYKILRKYQREVVWQVGRELNKSQVPMITNVGKSDCEGTLVRASSNDELAPILLKKSAARPVLRCAAAAPLAGGLVSVGRSEVGASLFRG